MNTVIAPIAAEHIASFRATLDQVAREKRYLAMVSTMIRWQWLCCGLRPNTSLDRTRQSGYTIRGLAHIDSDLGAEWARGLRKTPDSLR
ncbi:MAG: hypothetical protein O2931_03510 [Planctomycetota bacterium]|nr:hypothetical protein [Planctomycetota bacterium]MDA1177844.1 hypothetical protein [Planctomycetota bacterium]